MKKILTLAIAAAVLLAGCGVHVRPRRPHHPRRGYPVPIPGCVGGFAFVPDGCFASEFTDRVEVNCPESTAKFYGCTKP